MIKLSIALLLFSTSLLSANSVADRQESMRDYTKLMRAANNLIRDSVINDDLASIYEEIEEIMKVYPTLFPDDSFGGKSKASTDIIDNRDLFNQIAKETDMEIVCVFHSHPESEAHPSETDKKFMRVNPFPWIIYSCTTKDMNCFILENDNVKQIPIIES